VLVDGGEKPLRSKAINVGCYGDLLLYPDRRPRYQRLRLAKNENLPSGVYHSDEPHRFCKLRHDVVVQPVQVVLRVGKEKLERSKFRNHRADLVTQHL
jgi:hypothetical protein